MEDLLHVLSFQVFIGRKDFLATETQSHRVFFISL